MKQIIFFACIFVPMLVSAGNRFKNWDELQYEITSDSTVSVVWCSETKKGVIDLRSIVTYNGRAYKVTSINSNVFEFHKYITKVLIPNSVKSISKYLFNYCPELKSVEIPNSVRIIGVQAFSFCSSLRDITIPNSVISIGAYAFLSCKSLSSIFIPNSVKSIDRCAFQGCINLT